MDKKPNFVLIFDSKHTVTYPTGHWVCFTEPGFIGLGATPVDAMADCLTKISAKLLELKIDVDE